MIMEERNMSKWDKTIRIDDVPVHMYRLNSLAIETYGKEECNKGISVNGIILTSEWKTFLDKQGRLSKFVYNKETNKEGYLDWKSFKKSENKILEQCIRD